jgi:hypothetical protein
VTKYGGTIEDPRPGAATRVFARLLEQDHGRARAESVLAEAARRALRREVPDRDKRNAQFVSWHTLFAVLRDEGIATVDGTSIDAIEREHGDKYGPPSSFLDNYPRGWRDELPDWAEAAVVSGLDVARQQGGRPCKEEV